MDTQLVEIAQSCLSAAFDGTWDFPTIVRTLLAAGFEGYDVDYRRGTFTYFLPSGAGVQLGHAQDGGLGGGGVQSVRRRTGSARGTEQSAGVHLFRFLRESEDGRLRGVYGLVPRQTRRVLWANRRDACRALPEVSPRRRDLRPGHRVSSAVAAYPNPLSPRALRDHPTHHQPPRLRRALARCAGRGDRRAHVRSNFLNSRHLQPVRCPTRPWLL